MKFEPGEVSQLLQEWQRGNQHAADQVVHAVYDELRRIARGVMRGERPQHTLQPTALIHEAYLRVCHDEPVDVASKASFLKLMAAQMRRHLIDHARRRSAGKRGGGVAHEQARAGYITIRVATLGGSRTPTTSTSGSRLPIITRL